MKKWKAIRSIRWLWLVTIVVFTVPSFAQQSVTLEAALERALANNGDLVAARVRIQEAQARLRQAGLWPNPELELEGQFDNTFNDEGEYVFGAGIDQPFIVSGRIGAQKNVAAVDMDRTMAEVAELERNVAGQVRRAFTELLSIKEQMDLQKFLIELNRELLAATKLALKRGQVSEKDANAILISLQQAQQRQKMLETQRRSLLFELNRLMGQLPQSDLDAMGQLALEPLPDLSEFTLENALEKRPDFILAQFDVDLARAEHRLAKAERFEDWRIGAAYEREKTVVDGAPPQDVDQFVGLKLTVPLPLFDRKQGRIRETQAVEDRALKTVEAVKIQIAQELADAINRVKTLAPLLDSYKPGILQRAEDNVKLVETGYRQGLTIMVEVIQSRQQFAELKYSYIETLQEYHLALIDLEIASGIFPSTIKLKQPTKGRSHEKSTE